MITEEVIPLDLRKAEHVQCRANAAKHLVDLGLTDFQRASSANNVEYSNAYWFLAGLLGYANPISMINHFNDRDEGVCRMLISEHGLTILKMLEARKCEL
jgi:hypothetical protein